MRQFTLVIAALAALVWSGAAWAITDTTITVTDQQGQPLDEAKIKLERVEKTQKTDKTEKTEPKQAPRPKTPATNDKGEVTITHEDDDKTSDDRVIVIVTTKEGKTLRIRTTLKELLSGGKLVVSERSAQTPQTARTSEPSATRKPQRSSDSSSDTRSATESYYRYLSQYYSQSSDRSSDSYRSYYAYYAYYYYYYAQYYAAASIGAVNSSTSYQTTDAFSGPQGAFVRDVTSGGVVSRSGTGFVGSIGGEFPILRFDSNGGIINPVFLNPFQSGPAPGVQIPAAGTSRYAPESGRSAHAAAFPELTKKPPKQLQRPLAAFAIDTNVYFFAGGDAKINGIPGGPFNTPTGSDSFRISNNYMFTVGGVIITPVTPLVSIGVTGGFAELNQTVKYNCATFCAVAPAAPAFSATKDKWVGGEYVGGRAQMPIMIPGLPGSQIAIDYKHVFFGHYDVSLGSSATQRQINARLSPDMDLITARLAVPLR